jgi:hypothetical protein
MLTVPSPLSLIFIGAGPAAAADDPQVTRHPGLYSIVKA